jgi:hypothetical protein
LIRQKPSSRSLEGPRKLAFLIGCEMKVFDGPI